ncbi:MAG: hypothetical protein IPP61_01830 [Cytophagaceae bacterium]|nr:hypothetical protein [Cytophagaceae bacterium]MBL0301093.1 hypothetical protein [Cytophagaceae bacterium]MBL0323911.1 hypothetical protein [Cytophagaceae bacterium]
MTDQELEILEAYILGHLDGIQIVEVEEKLRTDKAWQENFGKIKVLKELPGRLQLREKIKAIQNEVLTEWKIDSTPKSRIISWPKIAITGIAASVALFVYFNVSNISIPGALTMQERGSETNISKADLVDFQMFKDAQQLLIDGKDKEAAQAFSVIKNSENLRKYYRDLARWLEVVALAETDKTKAGKLFREIEADADFKYKISFSDKIKLRARLLF